MKEKFKKIFLCIVIVVTLSFANINSIKAYEKVSLNNYNGTNILSVKTNNAVEEIKNAATPKILASSQELKCEGGISKLIKKYWKYVMLFAPILLMVMITLDFFKALFSSDADLMKKASDAAVKRVLATVLLLTLPLVLSAILGFFGLELCL